MSTYMRGEEERPSCSIKKEEGSSLGFTKKKEIAGEEWWEEGNLSTKDIAGKRGKKSTSFHSRLPGRRELPGSGKKEKWYMHEHKPAVESKRLFFEKKEKKHFAQYFRRGNS